MKLPVIYHIGPPLQPITVNNRSAISQFQVSDANIRTIYLPPKALVLMITLILPYTLNCTVQLMMHTE